MFLARQEFLYQALGTVARIETWFTGFYMHYLEALRVCKTLALLGILHKALQSSISHRNLGDGMG